jgi:hypothetical protein
VRHMTDMSATVKHESHEEGTTTSVVDLRTQLNRAYLSGDGAAVERVLALLAATQGGTQRETQGGTQGGIQRGTSKAA